MSVLEFSHLTVCNGFFGFLVLEFLPSVKIRNAFGVLLKKGSGMIYGHQRADYTSVPCSLHVC
jgi:hypothetical protein